LRGVGALPGARRPLRTSVLPLALIIRGLRTGSGAWHRGCGGAAWRGSRRRAQRAESEAILDRHFDPPPVNCGYWAAAVFAVVSLASDWARVPAAQEIVFCAPWPSSFS